MNSNKENVELHNSDNISVFSFCVDNKTTKSGKRSLLHSVTTASNTNSLSNAKSSPCSDFSIVPDDILSMIDFFIGARDCDTQTASNSSLLSGNGNTNCSMDSDLKEVNNVSRGIDLSDYKKTNLLNLRKRKIQKRPNNVQVRNKERADLTSAFSGLEKAIGRFGGEGFAAWFRS